MTEKQVGWRPGYKKFIEDFFQIIDKERNIVDFKLNPIQDKFVTKDSTSKRDVILKARQQGFSSVILALFTVDFLIKPNSRNIIVADEKENAEEMLEKVKFYIQSYEYKMAKKHPGFKVPLKYSSKYELYNEFTKSRYTIGTALKTEFGRSKTITNLHLSEAAFYRNMEKLLAGAMQAVVPNGRTIIETTANGFNYFKKFWDKSVNGETGFNAVFYKGSDFYDKDFLKQKHKELGRSFQQEYPDTPIEAFITSGECFFSGAALEIYKNTQGTPGDYNMMGFL
jgi:hypothetical protein